MRGNTNKVILEKVPICFTVNESLISFPSSKPRILRGLRSALLITAKSSMFESP
jgi:hypothetical protein